VRWVREPRPRRAGHRPGDGRATRRRQWGCQHTERRWHLVASRRSPRAAFWPPPELCPSAGLFSPRWRWRRPRRRSGAPRRLRFKLCYISRFKW